MDLRTPIFSSDEMTEIVHRTFVKSIDYHASLPSTNDRALELSRGEVEPLPTLILVDEQTAGRGRRGNRWWSSSGGLAFSLLMDSITMRLEPTVWPRISLAAGLAVCDAIDGILGNRTIGLKWPNDVLVDGRKLCGILAEIPPHRKDLLVLGIGVNVNSRVETAPAELRTSITSLRELTQREIALCQILIAILIELVEKLGWLADEQDELQQRWRQRCVLTGRTVDLQLADRMVSGVCQGIDHDGALLLATPGGVERCLSGVVERWI